MEQPNMFETVQTMYGTPIVRARNPHTSFQGEAEVTDSGRRKGHMAQLYNAIARQPGQIRYELAQATGLSEYEASKRLSDLKNTGWVQPGQSRKAPGGRHQQTWWPATNA
jgi:CRP-like cAMP-binding protein